MKKQKLNFTVMYRTNAAFFLFQGEGFFCALSIQSVHDEDAKTQEAG
jgi:hypothetical protein